MLLDRTLLLLAVLAGGAVFGGCAAPAGDEGAATGSESAFTVANGARFVVSASDDRIVLAKHVGGVAFPFDEASLLGKAILIHPVEHRAEAGVYARALAVESKGDRLVVTSEPLTLSEMETITESEIVRIYIDAGRVPLRPASVTRLGGVRPASSTSASTFGVENLSFGSSVGLSRPVTLAPGVTFDHLIEKATITPEVLFDWTEEKGLELGLHASLSWKSKLTIGGRAGGDFFKSMPLETPPYVAILPIGAAPVPVTFTASAFVVCSALTTGSVAVAVEIEANASVRGSFTVRPSLTTAPTDWVHEGSWAPEATGSASLHSTLATAPGVTVSCAIPRIELKALVASSAGPYIAITPMASLSGPSPDLSVSMAAGVQAKLLGISGGAEVTLLTWKP